MGVTGAFRVLCDGDHNAEQEEAEAEVVDAVSEQTRELEVVHPGSGGADPVRPPF